jgi:hypothetical protein
MQRLVFALTISLASAFPIAANAAAVSIDGRPVSGVVADHGHLMVPFRAPLEAIGANVIPVEMLADISHATVTYSADRQSATVTDWDLAGVNDVGNGNSKAFLYLWVWILVVSGFGYLFSAAAISRMTLRRA